MGKTPEAKRLTIVAYPPVDKWPELAEYETQGHTVIRLASQGADVVLGPRCWRMTDELKPYLALAIKNARKVKGDR